LVVIGNLAIVGASALARNGQYETFTVRGVGNFGRLDDKVWRGKAPTTEGYRNLAAYGVTTIVDLRAESDITDRSELFEELGIEGISLPIRDGQSPSEEQVQRFLDIVGDSGGVVFVHCGAGVGRTGVMAAAYLVATGQADGWSAMQRNLAVGPPSLEQLAFAARLDAEELADGASMDLPGFMVVALSRTLDAPRRIWHNLGL
jgi:protein tyrosine/serine phosphatase